jgi:hypothetical protein
MQQARNITSLGPKVRSGSIRLEFSASESADPNRVLNLSRAPDKRCAVKSWHGIVQQTVRFAIPVSISARFPCGNRAALLPARLASRPFHRANNPIARRGGKRNELSLRVRQREAMLVFTARGIWTQRRDPNSIFNFRGLLEPLCRRAIRIRRHPSFDVPAIDRQILWNAASLNKLSNHVPARVTIGPSPTHPGEPRTAPHDSKIRFSVEICTAGDKQPLADVARSVMRFPSHANVRT